MAAERGLNQPSGRSSGKRKRGITGMLSVAILTNNSTLIGLVILVVLAILVALKMRQMAKESQRARRESLASIVALLHAPEKATRLHALTLLAASPLMELSALEAPLSDLLKDPDPEVRLAAGKLLNQLHPPDQLLRQLTSRQSGEKLESIDKLAAVGGQKALTALLEIAARDPEQSYREAARQALARGENEETFPFLTNALLNNDPILKAAAEEIFQLAGKRALSALLAALKDPRKAIRAKAADLIAGLSLNEAGGALAAMLSDPVDEVRSHAARALSLLARPDPAILPKLVASLSDSSRAVQDEAACALAATGHPGALVPLLEFLQRRQSAAHSSPPPLLVIRFIGRSFPSDPVATAAFKNLLASGEEKLFIALARAMEQSAEEVKREWLERLPEAEPEVGAILQGLLVRLGKAGLKEPFRKAVGDRLPSQTKMRMIVARILGEIGRPDLAGEIVLLLSDQDPLVRKAAAWGAGRLGDYSLIDNLCQVLSDPDPEVRSEAAAALGRLAEQARISGHPSLESVAGLSEQMSAGLLQAVNDPVEAVRTEVAKALGAARLTMAIPSLIAWALGDSSNEVRAAAGEALRALPSSDILPLLAEALSYQEAEVRRRAAELLGHTGDAAAVTHLIRSLQDESPEVREQAGRSLWEIGASGQAETLLVHMQSPDPHIRASIAGLLGKVRAEEALPKLAGALRDPNPYVRSAVINALANFGSAAAAHLPALMERLEDPDPYVRARVIKALCLVAGEEASVKEAVVKAVSDPDPAVSKEAVTALFALAAQGTVEPLAGALSDAKVKIFASELLAEADPEILRMLLTVAKSATGESQAVLLGLLMETMKSVGTVEGYKQDLFSVDPKTRTAALEALSLFETEETAQIVAQVLANDPAPEVRKRAAILLGRIPGAAAQNALRRAAEQDLDPEVKETARSLVVLSV
jgi:HEAT repeat protein